MNSSRHSSKTKIVISPLSQIFGKPMLGMWLTSLMVLGSAIGVVYTKHLHRSRHIQLQQLQNTRDKLHVEWTQLLLEKGTLGSDVQVEKIAREQLRMIIPPPNQVAVIKP